MKMLCVFQKTARVRHIGHLDLMRAMQRALRRSGLPVCYSQGFNPHILLTFSAPLSVGAEGLREVMEVPVQSDVSCECFQKRLSAALPPALPLLSVRAVPDDHPAPMSLLRAAQYTIDFDEENTLYESLPAFLSQTEMNVVRHTKSGDKPCDIRPMIFAASGTAKRIVVTLSLCESATCRADLFLSTLCDFAKVDVPRCFLTRARMYGEKFIPLEEL